MARSITITGIDRRADRVYVRLGNGHEQEIPATTKPELVAWVKSAPMDLNTDEGLLVLALKIYLERDPTLATPNVIVGKTFTLDLAGKVSYADAVLRIG